MGELLLQENTGLKLIGYPPSTRARRSSLLNIVLAKLVGASNDATREDAAEQTSPAEGASPAEGESAAVVDSCAAVLRSMEVNSKRWVSTCFPSCVLGTQLANPTQSMIGDDRNCAGLTVEQYHALGDVSRPASYRSDSSTEVDRSFTACRYHFRFENDGNTLIVYAMFSPMPLLVFSPDTMEAIHYALRNDKYTPSNLLDNLSAMHNYYKNTTTRSSFPTLSSDMSHARARMSRMIRIEVDLTNDPLLKKTSIVRRLENTDEPKTVIYEAQGVSEYYTLQLSKVKDSTEVYAFEGMGFLHSLAWSVAHSGASAALPFHPELNSPSSATSYEKALGLLLRSLDKTSVAFLMMKSHRSLYCSSLDYTTQRQSQPRVSIGSLKTLRNVALTHIISSTSTHQTVKLEFTLRVFDPTLANYIFVSKDMHGRRDADGHSLNMGLEYACTSPKLVDVKCSLRFGFELKQTVPISMRGVAEKRRLDDSIVIKAELVFDEYCEFQSNNWYLDNQPPIAVHSESNVSTDNIKSSHDHFQFRFKVKDLTDEMQNGGSLDSESLVRMNKAFLEALSTSSAFEDNPSAATLETLTARCVLNRAFNRSDLSLLQVVQDAWSRRLTNEFAAENQKLDSATKAQRR